MTLGLEIALALALVAANGFFVATEFAIARIRTTHVNELEAAGRAGARSLRHAVEHLDAYLAACQLGITISSIGLGVVGKPAFEQLLEPITGELGNWSYAVSFAAAFGIVTLLHVVLGELSPKSLAIARNTRTALAVAPPMRFFYLMTKPFVDFFNLLGNLVLKPFGVPPAREVGHTPHSENELRELLRQSLDQGLLQLSDVEFTEGVFTFGDRRVEEIMVPRPDIVMLPADLSGEECLEAILASPHTRLPVSGESLDDIVGILHVRDFFAAMHERGLENIRAGDIVRAPHVVPETKDLASLLGEFRRAKQHMAIVVDEYGGVQGLVTLEDLLEEIIGDIEDEYDTPDDEIEQLDDSRALVHGTYSIQQFNERFGQTLPSDDFHTVGGLVFGALGRQAEPGDEAQSDGITFQVVEVDGPRIERLLAVLPPPAEEPADADASSPA
ncbi:MAG TPA: hemolysin family protein [Gaiellaceae bacterium]|nr:hemolysin family protein [Gaiellaceae bacterium]